MRSQLDVRLGVQTPQILHLPPDVVSLAAAEEAIELADAYGLCDGHPLDESQKITLRAGMGERKDGSWAATQVGDFKGRQGGGKSDSIAARELAGLILVGEPLIVHTAHEFPTANESFLRLVALFENYDDLRRRVRRVLYGNGTQSINLTSGQRILYKARTGGAGRGFTKAALVVYDEAQHLQGEHVAASGPARLAYANSQSWYAGSGGLATSAMAWKLRRRALSGQAGRLAYCEGTAEDVSIDKDGLIVSVAPDPTDRDGWAKANPGLGRWVTEESMAALYDELGPELFARECECIWDEEPNTATSSVIPGESWAATCDDGSSIDGPQVFALAVSDDRAWSTFAAAGRSNLGEFPHVEVVDTRQGTGWVVARAVELQARWGGTLAVPKSSPAASLVVDLDAARVDVVEVSTEDQAKACGQLYDAVLDGRFRHRRQDVLDVALRHAVKRDYGEAWVWSPKKSTVDISPLVAVTLALYAASQGTIDIADNVW